MRTRRHVDLKIGVRRALRICRLLQGRYPLEPLVAVPSISMVPKKSNRSFILDREVYGEIRPWWRRVHLIEGNCIVVNLDGNAFDVEDLLGYRDCGPDENSLRGCLAPCRNGRQKYCKN